jgi:hypothetical protein
VPIPVPSDLVMLLLGERVSAGALPLWLAVVALELVSLAGTGALFLAARGPGPVRAAPDRTAGSRQPPGPGPGPPVGERSRSAGERGFGCPQGPAGAGRRRRRPGGGGDPAGAARAPAAAPPGSWPRVPGPRPPRPRRPAGVSGHRAGHEGAPGRGRALPVRWTALHVQAGVARRGGTLPPRPVGAVASVMPGRLLDLLDGGRAAARARRPAGAAERRGGEQQHRQPGEHGGDENGAPRPPSRPRRRDRLFRQASLLHSRDLTRPRYGHRSKRRLNGHGAGQPWPGSRTPTSSRCRSRSAGSS